VRTLEDRRKRAQGVIKAVLMYGYSQKEVADYIGIHYSTVSKIVKKGGGNKKCKKQDLTPFTVKSQSFSIDYQM
jgi:transposase